MLSSQRFTYVNLYSGPMRVDVIVPILQRRKLRHIFLGRIEWANGLVKVVVFTPLIEVLPVTQGLVCCCVPVGHRPLAKTPLVRHVADLSIWTGGVSEWDSQWGESSLGGPSFLGSAVICWALLRTSCVAVGSAPPHHTSSSQPCPRPLPCLSQLHF